MIVTTCHRIVLQSLKPLSFNNVNNVRIMFLQTQRNFMTVTSRLVTKMEYQNVFFNNVQYCTQRKEQNLRPIKEIISPLQIKKRPLRKKKPFSDEEDIPIPGVKFISLLENIICK